jgi:hypothetical protein
MFPSMIERRQNKRSLRELVRGAVDTALELVTLGEAHLPARTTPAAPTAVHPHRRQLDHRRRRRRTGMVPPRPQVCTSPVHRPAARPTT